MVQGTIIDGRRMTMEPVARCESCGMPFDNVEDHALGEAARPYCRYCTDDVGQLLPFDTRLARVTDWMMQESSLDRSTAEKVAREQMRSLPAWRDHPEVRH